ncbi:MAG: ATP-dependent DNA ligase [Candidatus Rokuibacteriota bacterium]|nr:MAG: ATP-dependent DNA ligase [Candidatus Rokubacteria bacterium]
MTLFAEFAGLGRRLEATSGRLEKRRLVADFLRAVEADEVGLAVAFLIGRPFPSSDPRVLGVRWLPREVASGGGPPLTLADVGAAFADVAAAAGAGSRRTRDARLTELARRASPDERDFLDRIIGGELRTGVSHGLVLEAIALAADADVAAVRRAALFLGDLAAVAALARAGGAAALSGAAPRPFVPLLPMLAEIATDFGDVLRAHGGRTALEFKYDGARVQVHREGERVGVWTRRLSDVTRSLPDIVAVTRELAGAPFILDGEVVALDAAGRPLPFQELMRRFRRVHGVEALVREMPLALHFFDCLMLDGRSLIDAPYAERWAALTRVTGGRYLAERALVGDVDAAQAFHARAVAAGHEGVMAKDLGSAYEPGGRGKRWFKLKAAETVDCVIVAADRGSGRRVGWLSNYHLAVRDGEAFADVGKTFKGLTDAQFAAMTDRLRALALEDDGYTVRVRPEVVVEVEYNEIQRSPTYRSGLALRFARIARIRDDKAPGQATTLDELRALYERQFATKGRAG